MGDINSKWPVVNYLWEYKQFSLDKYLLALNVVEPYDMQLSVYRGVKEFYIRMAYGRNYVTVVEDLKHLIEFDPWHRRFKCFPKTAYSFGYEHRDSQYACAGHYIMDNGNNTTIRNHYDCYIITTTIEGETVYCLDLFTA